MTGDKREKTTLPEQDGEGDNTHAGQNPTAKHLGINLVPCLLVAHLEICRPKPDLWNDMSIYHCIVSYQAHLTAPVSDPVQDHTGEHREALEDFEETGGGEESRHGFGLFLF